MAKEEYIYGNSLPNSQYAATDNFSNFWLWKLEQVYRKKYDTDLPAYIHFCFALNTDNWAKQSEALVYLGGLKGCAPRPKISSFSGSFRGKFAK